LVIVDNSPTRWNVKMLEAIGITYAPNMLAPSSWSHDHIMLHSVGAEAMDEQIKQFMAFAQKMSLKAEPGPLVSTTSEPELYEHLIKVEPAFVKMMSNAEFALGVTKDPAARRLAYNIILVARLREKSYDVEDGVYTVSTDAAADEIIKDGFMARLVATVLDTGWNDALDAAWNALGVNWHVEGSYTDELQDWDGKLDELSKHRFNFEDKYTFEFSDEDVKPYLSDPGGEDLSNDDAAEAFADYISETLKDMGISDADAERLKAARWIADGHLVVGFSELGEKVEKIENF
jgi:hypothetical protein